MNRLSRTLLFALGWIILAAAASVAYSQGFPNKPVRVVVPFAAGSTGDVAARLIGHKFTENTGQQMIVDNIPGANAIIGTEYVAKSTPDGYTLLVGTDSEMVLNVGLYDRLPYDPVKDFVPVTVVSSNPLVFAVHPSLSAT